MNSGFLTPGTTKTESGTFTKDPVFFIDYDDTLGGVLIDGEIRGNGQAYFHVLDRFGDAMAQLGFNREEARKVQEQIDVEMCDKFGFGSSSRFPESLRETYRLLCYRKSMGYSEKIATRFYDSGFSVFTDFPYVALPGAVEAMRELHRLGKTVIVTKGSTMEQARKVEEAGFLDCIDDLIVVGSKDAEDWYRVVKLHSNGDSNRMWTIGNSTRSDINVPVEEFGLNAVWVTKYANDWAYECQKLTDPAPNRRIIQVETIDECVPMMKGLYE